MSIDGDICSEMPRPHKLTIHKWAEVNQLSYLSATLSHQAVAMSEMLYGISEKLHSGELDDKLPGHPPATEWLEMYRDHRRVFCAVGDYLELYDLNGRETEDVLVALRAMSALVRNDPQAFLDDYRRDMRKMKTSRLKAIIRLENREVRKAYLRHLEEMHEIAVKRSDPTDTAFGEHLLAIPELHFFVRVFFMCVIVYREFPIDLLRRARCGDLDAIEKLLRLDPQMMHERSIERWLNADGGGTSRARRERAMDWVNDGPIRKRDKWAFKQSMGGLISAMSRRLFFVIDKRQLKPQPLNAPQIMHLFDAWYRDRNGRREAVMNDPEFANVNSESWSKAIQRNRRVWDRLLFRSYPDMN